MKRYTASKIREIGKWIYTTVYKIGWDREVF